MKFNNMRLIKPLYTLFNFPTILKCILATCYTLHTLQKKNVKCNILMAKYSIWTIFTDFNGDGKPDNITFMIKRIKVHTTKALTEKGYRFPNNYGVEKFLEIFSGKLNIIIT